MKYTLATALLLVVVLASTAFAEDYGEGVKRCQDMDLDSCGAQPNCAVASDSKHIACTSTTHS